MPLILRKRNKILEINDEDNDWFQIPHYTFKQFLLALLGTMLITLILSLPLILAGYYWSKISPEERTNIQYIVAGLIIFVLLILNIRNWIKNGITI